MFESFCGQECPRSVKQGTLNFSVEFWIDR